MYGLLQSATIQHVNQFACWIRRETFININKASIVVWPESTSEGYLSILA